MTHVVVCQEWEETERGWGVRPDGATLHLTEADRAAYCAEYWRAEHARTGGMAPSVYSRESGRDYQVEVDQEMFGRIAAAMVAPVPRRGIAIRDAELRKLKRVGA